MEMSWWLEKCWDGIENSQSLNSSQISMLNVTVVIPTVYYQYIFDPWSFCAQI